MIPWWHYVIRDLLITDDGVVSFWPHYYMLAGYLPWSVFPLLLGALETCVKALLTHSLWVYDLCHTHCLSLTASFYIVFIFFYVLVLICICTGYVCGMNSVSICTHILHILSTGLLQLQRTYMLVETAFILL